MYEVAAKTILEELGYVVVPRSEFIFGWAALFACGIITAICAEKLRK